MATGTDQRQAALVSANTIRMGRVELRSSLRAQGRRGALMMARWLQGTLPPDIDRIYVWQLLKWVPKIGDTRAEEILRLVGVAPWARVRRLTARQRTEIAALLVVHAETGDERRQRLVAKTEKAIRDAKQVDRLRCSHCGERLQRRSRDGLCGFCREEQDT